MTDFIHGIILFAIILYFLNILVKTFLGDAKINVQASKHSPWKLESLTDNCMEVSTVIHVTNEGKQCGTIMDCYVRQLLPYEQFDGIRVYAKAELKGAPREDDYFEAVLVQKKGTKDDSIDIVIKVMLMDRKGNDIKERLTHMVDLPLDIVYQHAARYPWKISKETIVLPAEKIAELAHVQLAD